MTAVLAESDELEFDLLLRHNGGEKPGQELFDHGERINVHGSNKLEVVSTDSGRGSKSVSLV